MNQHKSPSLTKQVARIAWRRNVIGVVARLSGYPEEVVRKVYWRVVEAGRQ